MAGYGGSKPAFGPGGEILGPSPVSLLVDPRYQPTLREGLSQGVMKAQASVVYAHYDFRNFKRSHLGDQGLVK